jgi:hypothetical protein
MAKTPPTGSTQPTGRSSALEDTPPPQEQPPQARQTAAEPSLPAALASRPPPSTSSGLRQRGGLPPPGSVRQLAEQFEQSASMPTQVSGKGKAAASRPVSLSSLPPLPPSAATSAESLRPLTLLSDAEVAASIQAAQSRRISLASEQSPDAAALTRPSTASSAYTPVDAAPAQALGEASSAHSPADAPSSLRSIGIQTEDIVQEIARPSYLISDSYLAHGMANTIEVIAKGIASLEHFGYIRNTLIEKTSDWNGPLAQIAAAVLVAEGTGAAHYVGEMLLKPAITQMLGITINPRDPSKVFPNDNAVSASGESAASLRSRMKDQQSLANVGSLTGNLVGLVGFGLALGVRAQIGGTSVTSAVFASGVGGALMQLGHNVIKKLTAVEGEPNYEIRISNESLPERLKQAIADVTPKKIPGAEGAEERYETVAEVLERLAYDVTIGRGVPLLQGAAMQIAVQAGLEKGGYEPSFATGILAPVALLGVGFFPLHPPLKASYEGSGAPLELTLKNLNTKPTQLASLLSPTEDQKNKIAALQAADGLHNLYNQVVRIPSHLLVDGGKAAFKGLESVLEKSRASFSTARGAQES